MVTANITEPRYKFAQSKANEIWEKFVDKNIPVKLNDIVKGMDIAVKEDDLSMDGVARMDKSGIAFILYKKAMSDERKRFTVAHELGHIILEHITFGGDSSQLSSKSQEQEANQFAGSLLIPLKDLKTFMKNEDKTLDDIVKRYWVSRDAAGIAVKSNRLLNKLKV
jgi:Zn-dependent peptidase ImmA (M78 family)